VKAVNSEGWMSPGQRAELTFSSWDRLLGFVRRKFPKVGKYGGDEGGSGAALVEVLSDPAEMSRIARALREIDTAYAAAVREPEQKIEKARKDRAEAEKALLETVRINV
jgi:hypothetical protein